MIWTLAILPLALLLGTPIFAIFLIGAVATFVLFLSVPPVALHQIMFGGMENYALLAVPFFIFARRIDERVRHRATPDCLGSGADRSHTGQPGGFDPWSTAR